MVESIPIIIFFHELYLQAVWHWCGVSVSVWRAQTNNQPQTRTTIANESLPIVRHDIQHKTFVDLCNRLENLIFTEHPKQITENSKLTEPTCERFLNIDVHNSRFCAGTFNESVDELTKRFVSESFEG